MKYPTIPGNSKIWILFWKFATRCSTGALCFILIRNYNYSNISYRWEGGGRSLVSHDSVAVNGICHVWKKCRIEELNPRASMRASTLYLCIIPDLLIYPSGFVGLSDTVSLFLLLHTHTHTHEYTRAHAHKHTYKHTHTHTPLSRSMYVCPSHKIHHKLNILSTNFWYFNFSRSDQEHKQLTIYYITHSDCKTSRVSPRI